MARSQVVPAIWDRMLEQSVLNVGMGVGVGLASGFVLLSKSTIPHRRVELASRLVLQTICVDHATQNEPRGPAPRARRNFNAAPPRHTAPCRPLQRAAEHAWR